MSNESTTTPATPAKAAYSLADKGGSLLQILRDGVAVANYDTETKVVAVDADMVRYRAVIVRWLASQNIEVAASMIAGIDRAAPGETDRTAVFPLPVAGTTANPAVEPGIQAPPASAPVQQPASPPANIAPVAPAAGARPSVTVRASHATGGTPFAPHKHPKYPDGPDLDPQFGERTPAFVEWLAGRKG
ncbi:hypothetical protein OpiT1DRAFT_05424 [Opitutaceae bacterium TAV1]|nr:hypothetical protein OpiT1DRAFT_05424 [Opitutaceae bacterium TAV1]